MGGTSYDKGNRYSETVVGRKSPNAANIKVPNNPFDILKVCIHIYIKISLTWVLYQNSAGAVEFIKFIALPL